MQVCAAPIGLQLMVVAPAVVREPCVQRLVHVPNEVHDVLERREPLLVWRVRCKHRELVSVSSQFDGPMITIDDAEQPSLSVISDGVLANGDFAIKFSDVHQGHDQKRRQR